MNLFFNNNLLENLGKLKYIIEVDVAAWTHLYQTFQHILDIYVIKHAMGIPLNSVVAQHILLLALIQVFKTFFLWD